VNVLTEEKTTEKHWHALSVDDTCILLDVDLKKGLSEKVVKERLDKYGPNELPRPKPPGTLKRLIDQVSDPLIIALLVAALIAGVVALTSHEEGSFLVRFSDTIAILLIVALNAILGFIQEGKAEAALEALEKLTTPSARVLRDGKTVEISSKELVPGDIVKLEAGDAVPADLRIAEASDLNSQESSLTGESSSVTKSASAILEPGCTLADRINMLYMGTTVVRGRGRTLCVATGTKTELGKIGSLVASVEHKETPLQARLAAFSNQILWICLVVSAFLFFVGILQQNLTWPVLLLTAVSLAVAAIPEGLPAITTITLALGMQRMAKHGAIIRRLSAVETLGSATVICSDKTGTLTQNKMTVESVWNNGVTFTVNSDGYSCENDDEKTFSEPVFKELLETAVLCNQATIADGQMVGDPTETALLVLADRGGLDRPQMTENWERVQENPFDSEKQRMSVVVKDSEGKTRVQVKGSLESVLPLCRYYRKADETLGLGDTEREEIKLWCEKQAAEGQRILIFANREGLPEDGEDFEKDLVYLGSAAMYDPPRPEVAEAIATCRKAGIKVVMITGDHKLTAVSIAKKIGIWEEDSLAFNGNELSEMSDQEIETVIQHAAVFARATPEQKLRILRALMAKGEVVAMTGDGINDAPGLRASHIGVAMGDGGTDVAREASELVLLDDNFATIVKAVYEGRTIFGNIKKFIYFLLSVNAGLVAAVIISSFFDWIPLLSPLQLLWINLVTNGLPALALGVNPPDDAVMDEPPRNPEEPIVGKLELYNIAVTGFVMATAALVIFWLPGWWPELFTSPQMSGKLLEARGMAFTLLAFTALFHSFNCRSNFESLFKGLFSNVWLWGAFFTSAIIHLGTIVFAPVHAVFGTHFLSVNQWLVVLFLSLIPIPTAEILKLFYRRKLRLSAKNSQ
jgi:Ca2+-transporting ATPase